MKTVFLAILLSFGASVGLAQQVRGVVYVQSPSDAHNDFSRASIQAAVSNLNIGRQAGADYVYKYVEVATFNDAFKLGFDAEAKSVHGINTVAAEIYHGKYDESGTFQGMVVDRDPLHPEGQLASKIDPDMQHPHHCDESTVTTDKIAAEIAAENGGTYGTSTPPPPSTSGSGGGGGAPPPSGGTSGGSGGGGYYPPPSYYYPTPFWE